MSVLSWQKNELTAIVENTEIPLSENAGNMARGKIMTPPLQNIPSLPSGRKEKVLAARQQLAEGRYDLDVRLDVALDHLLESIITQNSTTGRSCSTVNPSTKLDCR
jgi:hypothetical protein